MARWDGTRIKHALFNLLSNAMSYTDPGGRIEIAVRRVGPQIAITVADTGIGIAPEDQERVFAPFVRGSGARGGAGLGLALVRSFVELHGGSVSLASTPGQGTTVTCLLPVQAGIDFKQASNA